MLDLCGYDISSLDSDLTGILTRSWGDSRGKAVRPIGTFADEEIIIPRGPFKNLRYSQYRKPASRLWFAEIESRRWLVHNYTGPTQSGKSLDAFIIPICWCLFEKEEDTIVGLPDMNMSRAKWNKDILPVILKTKYADLLPRTGQGSKGGTDVKEVSFRNGTHLTFMSFGSSDKGVAGDTAPNLIMTEVDGANQVSEASEEGTKIDQLMGRTLAFDDQAFIVKECTVTTDKGIIYSSYYAGSRGVIYRPCPHCKVYVSPERIHFRGWATANDDVEAGENAAFHCPNCAKTWTDEQRKEVNKKSVLVHRGQSISADGVVEGDYPRTTELGFRMSAVDNVFRSSRFLGSRMWKADRSVNQESSDKTIKQQEFAEPWVAGEEEELQVDMHEAAKRQVDTMRNIVPTGFDTITIGTDLRATQLHWVAIAWKADATCRVINYGTLKVRSRQLGVERALRAALQYLRDEILSKGFQSEDGETHHVDQWWIDVGWKNKTIYKFIRECWQDEFWAHHVYPYFGRGEMKQYNGKYSHKDKKTKYVRHIGDQFYFTYDLSEKVTYIIVNADHYKTFVHNRLRIPELAPLKEGDDPETVRELQPGAMSLFIHDDGDHLVYMRHLTAESEHKEFSAERGEYTVWKTISRVNHYFDATYSACAAAVFCGIETTPEVIRAEQVAATPPTNEESYDTGIVRPDGRMMEY